MTQLLPLPGCRLVRVAREGPADLTLVAEAKDDHARCLTYRAISTSVHSRYRRRPADLPASGKALRLQLEVRRFYCCDPACPAEPSPNGSRSCSPAMPNAPTGWPGHSVTGTVSSSAEHVVTAIETGASRREAARRFEISPASAVRWHEAFVQEGRTQAKPTGGDQRSNIRFLNAVEGAVPAGKTIHAILDNDATHKHPKVRAWLARHPRWTFHFTPTSASRLNAVEGFFSALTRRRLRRSTFTGVVDLQATIKRYIAEHNSRARPFTWTKPAADIVRAVSRLP